MTCPDTCRPNIMTKQTSASESVSSEPVEAWTSNTADSIDTKSVLTAATVVSLTLVDIWRKNHKFCVYELHYATYGTLNTLFTYLHNDLLTYLHVRTAIKASVTLVNILKECEFSMTCPDTCRPNIMTKQTSASESVSSEPVEAWTSNTADSIDTKSVLTAATVVSLTLVDIWRKNHKFCVYELHYATYGTLNTLFTYLHNDLLTYLQRTYCNKSFSYTCKHFERMWI